MDFYRRTFGEHFILNEEGGTFSIYGHQFAGMSFPGGPEFNSSISLQLLVDGQEEADRLWEALTKEGGKGGHCGWCTDPFGISWQVNPVQMYEYLNHSDEAISSFAWSALRTIVGKIELSKLHP